MTDENTSFIIVAQAGSKGNRPQRPGRDSRPRQSNREEIGMKYASRQNIFTSQLLYYQFEINPLTNQKINY